MKFVFQYLMFCAVLFSCKQKPDNQNSNPVNETLGVEKKETPNEPNDYPDAVNLNETDGTWAEVEERNQDFSNETHLPLSKNLKISTKEQLQALKAFEAFLREEEEFTMDQLNNLQFIKTDANGNQEFVFEYSVIVYPETNTWSLRFLYGTLVNGKIEAKIHEHVGSKGDRTASFKKIDEEGVFWFDTMSYAEDDPMCCPSVKDSVTYKIGPNQKFVETNN